MPQSPPSAWLLLWQLTVTSMSPNTSMPPFHNAWFAGVFTVSITTGLRQNFWQVPEAGNCRVLCKRCWGALPLQPPSWSSLIPAKVPLAYGHHANLLIMVVDSEAGRHQSAINPRRSAAIILSYYQLKPDLNCWPRSERLCILLPIS